MALNGTSEEDDALAKRLAALAASEQSPPDATGAPSASAVWGAVRAETIDARRGWRERLQELPTRIRVVLALGMGLGLAAVVALIAGVRSDLGTVAVVRYLLAMGGLALLALAAFSVSLRGAHQRPLGVRAWAVIALTLAVPVTLALLPGIWGPTEGNWSHIGYTCFGLGVATGALVSVPVFFMQRASVPVLARICAALAGGGVVAFAMLELHCPSNDVTHLLVGHAAVGGALVLVAALSVWMRRR